jgi:nitrogen fixation protein FixH
MQQFVRSSYNSGTHDRDLEVQKAEKVKEQRPVEKSEDGQQAEMNLKSEEELKARNNLEDGQLVVEKYDESGRLIKVTPPGYLPPGERA